MADHKLKFVVEAETGRAKAELKDFDRFFGSIGSGTGGIGSVFGGNLASEAVTRLTGFLTDGGKAILDYSSRLEQTKIGFETLMGGAAAASAHLRELQEFAKSTPFEFETLTQASRRLQNVGLEASKVIAVMRDIGNAAAAAGASSAELDGITLAFSQIIAKGKLSAEEVNQLAERGIPVWRMLEEQLGKSKAQIIKLSEQGKISSDVFLNAFQKFSQANFGDAMVRQSRTFAGAMSNIKDIALITSQEAFAPLYERISNFANDVAKSLSDQQGQAKDAGVSFGMAIGEGIGAGLRRSSTGDGGWLDYLGYILNPTQLSYELQAGIARGLAGFDDVANLPGLSGITLDPTTFTLVGNSLKTIAREARKIPSLKDQMESDTAEKQLKALEKTIDGLTSRIAFFGQESEVAAVKQKLIDDGVTNFNTSLAKNAISLAQQLDRLTAAKKAQDDYKAGLKSATDELKRMQDAARFDLLFPKASELDRFEFWVQSQTTNFRELHGEIEKTRASLQSAATVTAVRDSIREVAGAIKFLNEQTDKRLDRPTSEVTSTAIDVLANLKSSLPNVKVGVQQVAGEIDDFVNAYLSLENVVGKDAQALTEPLERFKKYLAEFKFGDNLALFGDRSELEDIAKAFINLGRAVSDARLKDGLKQIDEMLERVGVRIGDLGAKTKAEEFDRWLADPKITAAIVDRAKAYGMTADELTRLLRASATQGGDTSTRPRVVGDSGVPGGFMSSLDDATGRVRDMGDVWTQVGQMATEAFMQMGQGLGAMLESWVALGDQADVSMQKMIGAVLGGVAAQAATLSIFHLAMGIAALTPWGAIMYGPAPLHFKAAAVWGGIAVGTALVGRAVTGDANKSRGGSSSSGSSVGNRNRNENLQPSSRRDENTFISGRDRNPEARFVAAAIEKLTNKLEAMKPGDVLSAGIKQSRGAIGREMVRTLNSNAAVGVKMRKTMGGR